MTPMDTLLSSQISVVFTHYQIIREADENKQGDQQPDIMQRLGDLGTWRFLYKWDISTNFLPLSLWGPHRRGGRKCIRNTERIMQKGYSTPRRQICLNQYDESLHDLAETETTCTGPIRGPLYTNFGFHYIRVFLWDFWLCEQVCLFLCLLFGGTSSICVFCLILYPFCLIPLC